MSAEVSKNLDINELSGTFSTRYCREK